MRSEITKLAVGYFILKELSISTMKISLFPALHITPSSKVTQVGAADDLNLLEELRTVHRLRVSLQTQREKL